MAISGRQDLQKLSFLPTMLRQLVTCPGRPQICLFQKPYSIPKSIIVVQRVQSFSTNPNGWSIAQSKDLTKPEQ